MNDWKRCLTERGFSNKNRNSSGDTRKSPETSGQVLTPIKPADERRLRSHLTIICSWDATYLSLHLAPIYFKSCAANRVGDPWLLAVIKMHVQSIKRRNTRRLNANSLKIQLFYLWTNDCNIQNFILGLLSFKNHVSLLKSYLDWIRTVDSF
jgi:hypothetical protein